MRLSFKPVVAYKEDIDVWIYFDQLSGVLRYEIFCVAYDNSGQPTTLDFVVEEGVLDSREAPDLHVGCQPTGYCPLVQLSDYVLILPDVVTEITPVPDHLLQNYEKKLKQRAKPRIQKKLRALGYDILNSVEYR